MPPSKNARSGQFRQRLKTCRVRLPWWLAASDGSLVQKSAVVALAGSGRSSTRSAQSAGRDVAEPALLGAGNAYRGLWSTDAADEAAEVSDEALVDAALGNAVGVVVVNDLAGELGIPVLGHGLGQGVHVDHDLVTAPGLFLAALDVDDEDAVVVEDEQVRLASEDGGLSAESESVLVLEAYVVAAVGPLVSLLVEQGGMLREPVGLVEVGLFK